MMLLQGPDISGMLMHHTADAWTVELPFGFEWHLPRWPDTHLGPISVNLSPTKHVVFMLLTAGLVFLSMWLAGRSLERQRAGQQAPKGFGAAMEGLVLYVRDEICIASIGHDGARFAPLIMTLFFFILYANLLGLVPWGASVTGNLAVTATLALIVFFTVEIGGARKLGAKGYLGTIFPHIPGIEGAGGTVMSIAMAPIEIISKLVKPFALAVRLFGNMTAGHFAILALYGIIFLFGDLQGWNWAIGISTALLVLGIMMLELIVAFLQAYVFALLSAVFIGLMQHEH
ncbi:MAG TPA: F0F1 ATP synthase subunit A [Gemmatimonadales bacterium]|nr:F0F1 ATP synthase subunit A [Gemmatimonadales bacterium]